MKHRTSPATKPFFKAALRQDGTLELLVYEEIGYDFWTDGGVTAKTVKQQIDAAGPFTKIAVRINSPGGDAFEGVAIYQLLRAQGKPVDVFVDGVAASAASIIAMAGDTITIGVNAMLMIHNAWGMCMGNGADMRKMGDTLDKVSGSLAQTYVDRTGMKLDEVLALMDAETWMNAEEALANGFATEIAKKDNAAAMAMVPQFKSLAKMKNTPENLKPKADELPEGTCDCDCASCTGGDCPNCVNADCDDSNCQDCPAQNEETAADATGGKALSATGFSAEEIAEIRQVLAGVKLAPKEQPTNTPAAPAEQESNLNQYEARLKMLRAGA